jgi:hypothetical protein
LVPVPMMVGLDTVSPDTVDRDYPNGLTMGQLVAGELIRIDDYTGAGHVASYEDLADYLALMWKSRFNGAIGPLARW